MNNATEKYQVDLEVRYGIQFNAANERLFRRLKFLFDFLSLFAGSAAFAGAIAKDPLLAGIAGLGLAALAIINQLIAPGEVAVRFNEAYRRFTNLDRRTHEMRPSEIRNAIGEIRADAPWGVSSLGAVAYNRNLLANGREDALMPVSRWQRFVAFIA